MKNHGPGFIRIVDDAKSNIREITADEVLEDQLGNARLIVVDVREESEYAKEHAEGAVHLGKGIIERDVESLFPDPSTPLVLYCGGGFRSALAAYALTQMGYLRVFSLQGGYRAWKALGGGTTP